MGGALKSDHLYLIVAHRNSDKQGFKNEWGTQGRLMSVHTTTGVMDAAEKATSTGARIFIYEVNCPKVLKSHISQEVKIAEIRREESVVVFSDHQLIFRKPPFRATQKLYLKWSPLDPDERM